MFTNGSSESFLCAILESFVFNYFTQLIEIGVRKMSLNRRRWSNELLDSLMDFQNRTASELDDSLNKSKEEVPCTDGKIITESERSQISLSKDVVDEYNENSMPTLVLSGCDTSDRDNLSRNLLNLTMVEDDEKKDHGKINPFLNLNTKVENMTISSDGTARYFSCDSSNNQNTMDTQSLRSQSTQYSCEIFHEAVTFDSDNGIVRKENSSSQVNGSDQSSEFHSKKVIKTGDTRFSLNLMAFDKQGDEVIGHRYFSSPVEFPSLGKEQLGEIDQPDVWDALLELDQALSPIGEEENSTEERQPTPNNLLSRLSQKFKKTPSRFTEKLISILEDSVISTESPTKQNNAANCSGISLNRMTGEFRKLCKFIEDEFIEDESMPEWAPSMVNMTALCTDKTETPENEKVQKNPNSETPKNMIRRIQGTPSHVTSPLALRALLTPKNKIRSRNQTPIKQFTPSADKSFEYWERICDMMCDPASAEKIKKKLPVLQEDPKLSMDEMLTICERQMASLDDSTIDIRTSEPCKKTDSEIKLKVLQAPRSKSVSKMYDSEKKAKSSSKKKEVEKVDDKVDENVVLKVPVEEENLIDFKIDDKVDEDVVSKEPDKEENPIEGNLINLNDTINDTVLMSDSDTTSTDSSFLRRRIVDPNDQDSFKGIGEIDQNSFDYDYELLKPRKSNAHNSFENDFKLIAYTPQQRQSKTQSENSYDPDDPDCSILAELALRRQRCLETAKLMMEIDQDDPMTNADKTCVETLYKLGIQDKTFEEVEQDTKFLNTLNHCLEYRNYFSEKSKPYIKALQKFNTPEELKKKTTSIIRSQSHVSARKLSTTPALQRTNSAKTLRDKKMTPRATPSTAVSKVTPRVTRTSSLRATPRISSTTPRVSGTMSKVASTTPRITSTTPRPMPRSTSKLTPQVTKRTVYPNTEQSKPAVKLPSTTPKSLQKPLLRRPILRLSPKTTQKLTPPSELKPCTPRPASKLMVPMDPKIINNRKLTPPSELKPCTPRPALKVTSPSEKVITAKPTPKRVANLKILNDITPSPTLTPRPRFFVSPGKSPSVAITGRKKPATYFSEKPMKSPLTPHVFNHDIKSPIGLYINSVDNDLIQNIQGKTNDRLLTPVSYGENGREPKLKFRLASKENQSPTVKCDENIVLPTVRYHSAKKVQMIDNKSNFSPSAITPNSRTKKLLEPVENTIVIRHEGRMIEQNSNTDQSDYEMSIRVQQVAEKTTPFRR